MQKQHKGFTLIELLVVVLIIGILTSVALSQYQIFVRKTQYTQAVISANAIFTATQSYFLANGTWPSNIEDLDIEIKSKCDTWINFKGLTNERFVICCRDKSVAFRIDTYTRNLISQRSCEARAQDSNSNKVCQKVSKLSTPTSVITGGDSKPWNIYALP